MNTFDDIDAQTFQSLMGRKVVDTRGDAIGTLDAVTIGRYAMTIGAKDPNHYEAEAARSAGYHDVIAPPNMLAAIVEWGLGTPEARLLPDGTPQDGDMPLGEGELGLRVMGAGE